MYATEYIDDIMLSTLVDFSKTSDVCRLFKTNRRKSSIGSSNSGGTTARSFRLRSRLSRTCLTTVVSPPAASSSSRSSSFSSSSRTLSPLAAGNVRSTCSTSLTSCLTCATIFRRRWAAELDDDTKLVTTAAILSSTTKRILYATHRQKFVDRFKAGVIAVILLALLVTPTWGGNCWSAMVRNGRCTDLLSERVTREECCATDSVATAWSTDDLDAGTLFFWRVLGGGVPCYACKESCSGVQCGEGKKCVVRRGRPKCVCSPECRGGGGGGGGGGKARYQQGPVCGTDGRSYRTLCRLKKRACRRKSSSLAVAYYGNCQSSCDKIRCPAGKHCLVDQNLSPHCVRCARHCAEGSGRQVCGADGITYQSACHLREAACRKGKAIPVAYKGRCKHGATCGNVRCKERQTCLSDMVTGAPRCVTCSPRCPKPRSGPNGIAATTPICATNNRTYNSWCHMLKDACATGYVIETKHSGSCDTTGVTIANTVLDENHGKMS